MEILIGVILVLGGLLMMVGGIWLLVMAFKESLVWGFCCLFLQIAQPIFICTHWDRSWRPLLLSLFGFATVVAAVFAHRRKEQKSAKKTKNVFSYAKNIIN